MNALTSTPTALTDEQLDAISGGLIVSMPTNKYNKFAVVHDKTGILIRQERTLDEAIDSSSWYDGVSETLITRDQYKIWYGRDIYDPMPR